MVCVLWSNGLNDGCIDLPEEMVVGRSLFSQHYKFMPRAVFKFLPSAGSFWQIVLLTQHDWIKVFCYDGSEWRQLTEAPQTIDGNTMIKLMFHEKDEYTFKFIFQAADCKDVSMLSEIWESSIWDKKTTSLSPIPPPPVAQIAAPPPPDRLQTVMSVLEWLANYLEKHTWAAIISLILAIGGVWTVHNWPKLIPTHPPPTSDKK